MKILSEVILRKKNFQDFAKSKTILKTKAASDFCFSFSFDVSIFFKIKKYTADVSALKWKVF